MAEEVILTSDDLITGPPSPVLPPDLAAKVLEGVDTCADKLRSLFECLQVNEVEPFCQDNIIAFRRCAQNRDSKLRQRLTAVEAEAVCERDPRGNEARLGELKGEVELLERKLILLSAAPGADGFQMRWRLHGEITDTKSRMKALEEAMSRQHKESSIKEQRSGKSWWRLF